MTQETVPDKCKCLNIELPFTQGDIAYLVLRQRVWWAELVGPVKIKNIRIYIDDIPPSEPLIYYDFVPADDKVRFVTSYGFIDSRSFFRTKQEAEKHIRENYDGRWEAETL